MSDISGGATWVGIGQGRGRAQVGGAVASASQQNATRLTARQQRAAELLADDELTDAAIAARVGLKDRTQLWRWKQQPAFLAYVAELREAFRRRMLTAGLASKARRVRALNDAAERLCADLEAADCTITVRVTRRGGETAEYAVFDAPRLQAFRALLEDIAVEMGERQPTRRRGR